MLDLKRQYQPLQAELLAALGHVLETQHFILGEPAAQFEAEAARHLGTRAGIACSSGTDALWLALRAASIGEGDQVITTPFSFFASVSAIVRAGATPLLADIDPVTFNLCPGKVEELLKADTQKKIKAILPVHLYGQTANWDAFERLAAEYGVKLIEDAAQAWGARWKDRRAGSLGDAAAFSFYPTKNLSAAGDAGMVSTNNDEIAERARMLRQHGMRRRYYHDELGWNTRMDGMQAAILSVKLKYIDGWNDARRAAARRYNDLFKAAGIVEAGSDPVSGVVLPVEAAHCHHVWHQYVIRAPRRDDLRQSLVEQKIGSEVYYPVPLHLQKPFANLGYKPGDFPQAERAAAEVLALPIYAEVTPEEQKRVVDAIADFLG